MQNCIKEVTINLNKYELGVACDTLYSFMWDDFCDWYIELSKPALYGEDENKKAGALAVLCYVLENALKLLHPFIPFVTEEIYSHLPTVSGSIMVAEFPRYNAKRAYKKEAKSFEGVMEIIKSVRNIKANVGCPASKKVDIYAVASESKRLIQANKNSIVKLAGANDIIFIDDAKELPEKTVSHVCEICQIYIPLGELVDIEKEKVRLTAELERVDAEIARANGKLSNQSFVAKAPKKLVEEEQAKLEKYTAMREKLEKQLQEL
ncbi:MAG: class I tRNA ligase family protein [Clostridia bacterium]|nr:class I tRNA ligase family protein [Clostridia bacterium]